MMSKDLNKTDKQEYFTKLTLIGVFLSIFAAFVSRLSFWRREHPDFKISPFDLALLGFATFRLGRLVSYDRVAEPLRYPFAETVPDKTGAGESVEPREDVSGLRRSLGQLLCCPICVGTWVASGLVYGLHVLPSPTRVFLAIMGTTGVAELLEALTEMFSWTGQLARTLAGAQEKDQQSGIQESTSVLNLFRSGGNYYVRNDHEKHYRQSQP